VIDQNVEIKKIVRLEVGNSFTDIKLNIPNKNDEKLLKYPHRKWESQYLARTSSFVQQF